jgi:RND family efflux transporter MFP subunit
MPPRMTINLPDPSGFPDVADMDRWIAFSALLCAGSFAQAQQAPERQIPCLIEPSARIVIKSPIAAVIAQIPVDRGSVVRKGQTLVTLESTEEQAALASARYRAVMEGQMQAAESRVVYLREKLERRQSLQQQNFVSTQDRDDVAAEARTAAAELVAAKDARELARLDTQRMAAVLGKHTIVSPANAIVTELLQHPGEMAQAGETAGAILKLAQIDPLKVEMVLPIARHGRLKPGDVVIVKPESPFKGAYKATVRVVDRVMDPASGTFGVRLELPNPNGSISAGVRCSVEF